MSKELELRKLIARVCEKRGGPHLGSMTVEQYCDALVKEWCDTEEELTQAIKCFYGMLEDQPVDDGVALTDLIVARKV